MSIFYTLLILFQCVSLYSLDIYLIGYRNGVGLNRDIDILQQELTTLGHNVTFVDCHTKLSLPKADRSIFIDVYEEHFFPFAEKNYFLPNPEWCVWTKEQLAKFDLILCKTKEAERIFTLQNLPAKYISFSSVDKYDKDVIKDYRTPLHLAGAAIQKGTKTVVNTWMSNPQFPLLFLIRHKQHFPIPETKNIKLISEYLSDDALALLQNSFGVHICPSETEGFGHYIVEAMSCGNVVITTDAPPMNEFISDKRCLVKHKGTNPWNWATRYFVDPWRLDLAISDILHLSEKELREIGQKNRELYLSNQQLFREKLAQVFRKDFVVEKEKSLWQMTDFLWNLGMSSLCNLGIDVNPIRFFQDYHGRKLFKREFVNAKKGDIAWMRCKEFPIFCQEVLPELKVPIVLMITDGDESFPSAIAKSVDLESILRSDRIMHIFAQNCDYKGTSKKISNFPIGIDFHTVAYRCSYWGEKGSPKEQETILNNILKQLKPTYLRKPKAFVDFQLADSIRDGDCKRYLELGETRTSIFQQLLATGLIEYGERMSRSDLWKKKGEYAFSISPHGNGLDCHRTWEDLALGCIVIVKTSTLDPLYDGLPVVIVKDWSEVNATNLAIWLAKYKDAFTDPKYREKLTNTYWMNKIKLAADGRR